MTDVHTHLCWAGSRAGDAGDSGYSYLDIASGEEDLGTVSKTREASVEELAKLTASRQKINAGHHNRRGEKRRVEC
jgi:imidazolonepropionase-like amidohydrolase